MSLMNAPFTTVPYVTWYKKKERRERIPIDLYLNVDKGLYLGGESDDIVSKDGDDDISHTDTLNSNKISLSSVNQSYALSSTIDNNSNTIITNTINNNLDDLNSVSTLSTNNKQIQPPKKKKKKKNIPISNSVMNTTYVYLPRTFNKAATGRVSRLWKSYVSDPFWEWRERKALERRHPVIKYYENRIIEYEAQRIANIAIEMQHHEEVVTRAAARLDKIRKGLQRTVHIQEYIADVHLKEIDLRNKQHQRSDYNVFYYQKWSSDDRIKNEIKIENDIKIQNEINDNNEKLRIYNEREAIKKYEYNFIEDDIEETQKINKMMRQYGTIPGINPKDALPCNMSERIKDKNSLPDIPNNNSTKKKHRNKQDSTTDSKDNTENTTLPDINSDKQWQKHKNILSSVGLKQKVPEISRKAKELTVTLKDSIDFTINPKVKGRMPWHSGGSTSSNITMTVFDIDLTLYRDLEVLICNNIGERGALCLSAEFIRGACPSLINLNLNRCYIQTRGFGRLLNGIRLSRLDNLQELHLRGNQLGARSIEYLRSTIEKGALTNVILIDLSENELMVEGSYAVASLLSSGLIVTVKELRLQRNGFGNEGFAHLANTIRSIHDEKCPQVVSIKIGENNASPEIVQEFAPYPSYIIP